jgi:hypothetical protein
MPYLLVVVVATGYVCYGAYRLGRRSDFLAIGLAPLLVRVAWYVLLDLARIPQGEGAAAGVVVIQAGLWYIGTVCVLLALILLGTSVYVRRSIVASGMLLCVVCPAMLVLGYRALAHRRVEPAVKAPIAPPRDSFLEGYAWAVDNGIDTESKCVNGSPAFIDGCKRAVHRR